LLKLEAEEHLPNKNELIVLYCASGIRSLDAASELLSLGYREVYSLAGGISRWHELGHAITKPKGSNLATEQRERYARHLSIPQIGVKGQEKLIASRVLLVGAGGLGCPAAYYLAAAGVGTLGIVDNDVVEGSNLQRQILHSTASIGKPKVDSARQTLIGYNPHTKIETFEDLLVADNVESIISKFDIVLDGSDNFSTKYLLNDACRRLGIPLVYGSVYQFEGQVSIFLPNGPCYRCLFPEPPPACSVPSCAEAGVLGVLPGIIGLLQSNEVIKTSC